MMNTLNRMFQESVRKYASMPALSSKAGGEYKSVTYSEMGAKVRTLASGLVDLGVQKGDRIALISENRPEWAVADMAIAHVGAINVAAFPTLPPGQVGYIVGDSGSKLILVSDKKQLAKALEVKKVQPDLRIITMDCPADAVNDVITLDDVMRRGEASPLNDTDYEDLWRSVQPDDWASIIYTSGTTGDPKGAILSHYNFASNVEAAQDALTFEPGDVLLSFVPLNHVMGRLVDLYLALGCGATIAYVEDLRRLRQNMAEVRPHYVTLVPRVFEMFQEGLLRNVAKESDLKQKLFNWALSVGERRTERIQDRQAVPFLLAFKWRFADTLVFSKIRGRLGLNRLKLFLTGSAPLPKATAEFFSAMGVTILQGYGLTETSPLVSVSRPAWIKFGTVGPPVIDVEVKIAADGEILVRGPNIMQGYYNMPEKTAEVIESDGWFHTGDIGEFDEDGFLKITDRKKDLLVLANGKKVAPQPIENLLKESPYISQVILFGDKQSIVTALVVPLFERVKAWVKERGISVSSIKDKELAQLAAVKSLIQEEIERLSGHLANFEKVHRFSLIDQEFTVEGGEMTPTLKVKRRVVLEKYRDVIKSMYR